MSSLIDSRRAIYSAAPNRNAEPRFMPQHTHRRLSLIRRSRSSLGWGLTVLACAHVALSALIAWGPDELGNHVQLDISSSDPYAARIVLDHYVALLGIPEGMLQVSSDGTGAVLVPWGTVSAAVVGPDGKPVVKTDLSFDWVSDVNGLECGNGDAGYGVSWDGTPTAIPCQAGIWTIRVRTAAPASRRPSSACPTIRAF